MSDVIVFTTLAITTGAFVGFVLGLIGGGGSILAVPALVYVVGASTVHAAIGTSAVAVTLNAVANLALRAREGAIKWRCAFTFASAGVVGAMTGAAFGKAFDGQKLLALFGLVMIAVGIAMSRPPRLPSRADVRLTRDSARELAPRLLAMGAIVGFLSGFFGIGGGFLIVPGLVWATRMPLRDAVGASLVAVAAFGLTTSVSYALSGHVDPRLAMLVVMGGLAGGLFGTRASAMIGARKEMLARVFSIFTILVGVYVSARGIVALYFRA